MDRQFARSNDTANFYTRQYLDVEDRVLLDELPRLDCSDGGVYYFGASNMKWATRIPDLPQAEQRRIHNFAAGEAQPPYPLQFLQYLIDYHHLLEAGPEKTLVVYGTSFLSARALPDPKLAFFGNLWQRYGLYTYQPDKGIRPVPMRPWVQAALPRKRRCTSLCNLHGSLRPRPVPAGGGIGTRPNGLRQMLFAPYGRRLACGDAKAWPATGHAGRLRPGPAHAHDRGPAAVGELAPRHCPIRPSPQRTVTAVCRAKGVPLVDLSRPGAR